MAEQKGRILGVSAPWCFYTPYPYPMEYAVFFYGRACDPGDYQFISILFMFSPASYPLAHRTYHDESMDIFLDRCFVVCSTLALAAVRDGLYVDISFLHCQSCQLSVGTSIPDEIYSRKGLENGARTICGLVVLWFLLGVVEYVLMAEMDLYISVFESVQNF